MEDRQPSRGAPGSPSRFRGRGWRERFRQGRVLQCRQKHASAAAPRRWPSGSWDALAAQYTWGAWPHLTPVRKGARGMTYVIAQPCIGLKDASCVEVCPVDCIHSDDDSDMYFIDPDECIDCGVCAEVCPVEAIFFEDDLPEQWNSFLQLNRAYFENK